MDDAELQRRKDLCAAKIDRISRTRPSSRPAPRLRFVAKHQSHARFNHRLNEIKVAVAGVLDDPAMTDGMIEAMVAHEMGHWADPDLATSIKRSVIVTYSCIALGLIVAIAIAVRTGHVDNATILPIVIAGGAGYGLSIALSPFLQWKGEYSADRFAAESTSPDTIISLMEHFRAQESRYAPLSTFATHPSRTRRIRRIELDTSTGSVPPPIR